MRFHFIQDGALKTVSAMAAWGQAEGPRSGLPGKHFLHHSYSVVSGVDPSPSARGAQTTTKGLSSLPRSEKQAGPHIRAQALPQGGMDTPRGAPVQVPPASPGGLVQILSVQARLEVHDVTSISFNEVYSVHMSQSEFSSLQVSTLPNLWGKCAVASHGL